MEISPVNGVKSNLNVEKQENSEINSVNIEPKKDGDKKIALALAALATTAAAGVGVAVAAKKGKINLSILENSVQNTADDVGKVVKDTADDVVHAAVKQSKMPQGRNEFVEESTQRIKKLQNELKNCKDPLRRGYIKRDIGLEQQHRWLGMEAARKGTLSPNDFALYDKHGVDLGEKAMQAVRGANDVSRHHPDVVQKNKLEKLYGHIIDSVEKGSFIDESGNITPKMNGLIKQLSKRTGLEFSSPEEAIITAAGKKLELTSKDIIISDILDALEDKLKTVRK